MSGSYGRDWIWPTGRIVAIFRSEIHGRQPGLPIKTIRNELDGLRARRLCGSQENRCVSERESRASLGNGFPPCDRIID